MSSFISELQKALADGDIQELYWTVRNLALSCDNVCIKLNPLIGGKFHEAVRDGLCEGQHLRKQLGDKTWSLYVSAGWQP